VSYINAIETALPDNCFSQKTFTEFYLNSTEDKTNHRKINIVSKRSGIGERYSVIKDFGVEPPDFEFFVKDKFLFPEPNLSTRMQLYRQHAVALSAKAIRRIPNFEEIKKGITHLITVTCTGMFAPGNDIDLIHELQLNPAISRSGINFMGCNAAIIALKQADTICKSDPEANVLIVCTELCTIHFQKQYNDDYILSNLIFGDGAAAVLVSSKPSGNYSYPVEITRFDSMIAYNGYKDMAWQLSETGFMMNLSSYVSSIIKENMQPLFDAIGLKADHIQHWAIHPGGKKILDDVSLALQLSPDRLMSSYEVLNKFGNMSSPTVLFVLKQQLEKQSGASRGDKVFTAAFGPGLSIETMQLKYV
jgi:predicted naringenin-chalcone synthase